MAIPGIVVLSVFLALRGWTEPTQAAVPAIVLGLGALVIISIILRVMHRPITVEVEALDAHAAPDVDSLDADETAELESPEDGPTDEARKKRASWYEMPYPDPDEEDEDDEPAAQPAATSPGQHWSDGDYPDPETEQAS